jgi:hypothetical protein
VTHRSGAVPVADVLPRKALPSLLSVKVVDPEIVLALRPTPPPTYGVKPQ